MPTKPKQVKEVRTVYRTKKVTTKRKTATKPKALAEIQLTDHPHVIRREGFRGGRPIIRGTRMPVWLIAAMWKSGDTPDEIREAYSHISLAAIFDALSYYLDHRAEIESQIAENRIEQVLKDTGATMDKDGVITFPNG